MRWNVPAVTAILGFSFLILGLFCAGIIFPKLEEYLIKKATAMEEGSKAFKSWKKIPFPFKLKVYFFNVTNPDDVERGAKPILKELGPYIYNEFREREILYLDEDNDTIKYNQKKRYVFDSEASGCHFEDDVVTIVHFPVVGMSHKINKVSPMLLQMLNDALPDLFPKTKSVFITNTVKNILFDGLEILCGSESVEMICDGIKSNLPHSMRLAENNIDVLLALFYHANISSDGPYEIICGIKNPEKGKIISYKEEKIFTQWNAKCSEFHGTDLTINSGFSEIPKKIDFLVPDFCRYLSTKFSHETEYLGLPTYQFQSEILFRKKECFCNKKTDEEGEELEELNCPPDGTMDITACGASIILSQPHFLNSEKFLLDYVKGLKPNVKKHETVIIMEPKTGLALNVKTRIQMNVYLKPYESVDILRNLSEGYFPFLWIENGAEVPLHIIEEVKDNLNKLKIFDIIKYLFFAAGVILLAVSLICALIKDKIVCSCKRNTVSDTNLRMGRLIDFYSDIKTVQQRDHGNAWRITQ